MRCFSIINGKVQVGFANPNNVVKGVIQLGTMDVNVVDGAPGTIFHAHVEGPQSAGVFTERETVELLCGAPALLDTKHALVHCAFTTRGARSRVPFIVVKAYLRGEVRMPLKTLVTVTGEEEGRVCTTNIVTLFHDGDEIYVYGGHPIVELRPKAVFNYAQVLGLTSPVSLESGIEVAPGTARGWSETEVDDDDD